MRPASSCPRSVCRHWWRTHGPWRRRSTFSARRSMPCMIASACLPSSNRTVRVSIASPLPTSAASLPRNERAPEMSNMMRDSQIMAQIKDENLGYMSDMALELAQMAEDTGLATLAYLFRMAALEASTANSVLAEPDDLPRQMTSH